MTAIEHYREKQKSRLKCLRKRPGKKAAERKSRTTQTKSTAWMIKTEEEEEGERKRAIARGEHWYPTRRDLIEEFGDASPAAWHAWYDMEYGTSMSD